MSDPTPPSWPTPSQLRDLVEALEAARGHDVFELWAQIIIPAGVGLATLLVALAAYRAGRRSEALARKIELQRDEDDAQRYAEQRRERLLAMARDEARLAMRWVHIESNLTMSMRFRHDVLSLPAERDPEVARMDAITALDQSLVIGAEDLLKVTELELRNLHSRMPAADLFPDGEEGGPRGEPPKSSMRENAFDWREQRMLHRIRSWGRDPEQAAPVIAYELESALSAPDAFWDYRLAFPGTDMPAWEPDPRDN